MKNILFDAVQAQVILNNCPPADYGRLFVELRINFARKHHIIYDVVSTVHGADFFENIIRTAALGEEWKENGEYGKNFKYLTRSAAEEIYENYKKNNR